MVMKKQVIGVQVEHRQRALEPTIRITAVSNPCHRKIDCDSAIRPEG
jgi:hypothetical protein